MGITSKAPKKIPRTENFSYHRIILLVHNLGLFITDTELQTGQRRLSINLKRAAGEREVCGTGLSLISVLSGHPCAPVRSCELALWRKCATDVASRYLFVYCCC